MTASNELFASSSNDQTIALARSAEVGSPDHYPLPEEWRLFGEIVNLRAALRGPPDAMWQISFQGPSAFSLCLEGPDQKPSAATVMAMMVSLFLAEADHPDRRWETTRVALAVLQQARKDKDGTAEPLHFGALVEAARNRISLLREAILEGSMLLANRLENALGASPECRTDLEAMRAHMRDPLPTRQAVDASAERFNRLCAVPGFLSAFREGLAEQPFVLNELLAKVLETLGSEGEKLAQSLRKRESSFRKAENPYAPWTPWIRMVSETGLPGPPAVRWLFQAIWYDIVRPKIEQVRKNPAALARVVASETMGMLAFQVPRFQGRQQAMVFPQDSGWSLAPSIDTEFSAAVLRGTGDLSSEVAIDLFEWLITTAHRQHANEKGDFRNLLVEGGWSELARLLGATRSGSADKVRSLVLAFAHLRYDLRGWRGNLLTYAETKAAPGRKACVSLTLGDMLLQGFTFTLKEASGSVAQLAREDRQLVPILGKAAVVGSPTSYGAQRRMTWALATVLRSRAVELARDGGVNLSPHDWADLACKAGAPRSATLLGKVQTAWEEGDESKAIPPLIVKSGSMVTLHESRKPALDFIKQAGERSQRQSDRGKKAVQVRSRTGKAKKPA